MLALIGSCAILSVASSHRDAAQASADRLEALAKRLEAMQLQVAVTGTPAVQVAGAAASATADKFALSGVTPTDFQMNRGDCWL